MAAARKSMTLVASLGVIAAATAFAPTPASAGFFDQLFGGLRHAFTPRHHSEPPRHIDRSDPFTSLARALSDDDAPRGPEHVATRDNGPSRGFCVRTCDGHFFPVQARPGMSAADVCHSFCPASETHVYSGSNIDYATTGDGSRYADLPNAFRYRKQIVSGCTCNGRTAFGLARVDVAQDTTLKPGDVVATKAGMTVVEAGRGKQAELTPVSSANIGKSERAALSQLRVMQDYGTPRNEVTGSVAAPKDQKSAELEKGR
ncbi:MAG TPA: DUF2865 domain-containing protein [Pseudolabrys sp.]|jgi:hypothetical protein|nr:DUF2865 domain-containing protein [Pseudolabrys sp.]